MKNTHGGARKGSGAPLKHNEPTVYVASRIPLSLVQAMDKLGTRTETIIKALKTYLLGNQ